MAIPMLSPQFKGTVEPILNVTFDGLYNTRREYAEIFTEMNAPYPRAYYEEQVLSGFDKAPEIPEGMPINYMSGQTAFYARAVYAVYGLGFALSRQLQEDGDHIAIGNVYSQHAAKSMVETEETLYANVLNYSFNNAYTGNPGDGVSLVNASHPLINGGTWSNLLPTAANLSQTSIEQMLIQIWNATDLNGKKIGLQPKKLVVANANGLQAEVILKSGLRTGTANNDVNPVNSMNAIPGGYQRMSRLTSPYAWWIQTDAPRGLLAITRTKLKKGMEGDFETDSMRYKVTKRFAPLFVDPHCVYGTPGV